MDELTKRRLVHNEELFRQVNEAREASSSAEQDQKLSFVCECSDRECTGRIQMTTSDFDRVRRSANRYVILPGHGIPEIEHTVEERGAFEVVAKDAA